MDAFTVSSPHQPLSSTNASEIRLVTLHPGLWHEQIVCTLTHVSLDDNPSYNTVSYVWGDPAALHEITLDGVSFPVTANLYQVLRRLREYRQWHREDNGPPTPLTLWIDALCINQADRLERAAQVQNMTQIYSKATSLFAYIGEVESQKEQAISDLFAIPLQPLKRDDDEENNEVGAEAGDDGSVQSFSLGANWYSWKELSQRVDADEYEMKKCLIDLCNEPFFSRIWIVQELALSQRFDVTVLYGSCSTYSVFLLELIMAIRYDHARSHSDFLEICGISSNALAMLSGTYTIQRPEASTEVEAAQHLVELMRATSHYRATEPRDRIYALLGLINKEFLPTELLPSYDTPIETVYQGWTRFLLEHTGDLSIMDQSFVQGEGVPTWVSSLAMAQFAQTPGAHPANVRFSDDGTIIYVRGQLMCFVSAFYSPSLLETSSLSDGPRDKQGVSLRAKAIEFERTLVRQVRVNKEYGEVYLPYLFDLMMKQRGSPVGEMDLQDEVLQVYEQIISGNERWAEASDEVLLALKWILSDNHWVLLCDGAVHPVEARGGLVRPADEVYLLNDSGGLTILRRCEEQETFLRIAYCNAGTEHEPWPQLELALKEQLDVAVGGRGTFRPQLGVIDIPIS